MKLLLNLFAIFLIINVSTAQNKEVERIFNKAENLYKMEKFNEAIVEYSKVLAIDPEHLNSLLRRAFAFSVNQKYDFAVRDYSKIISTHPKHLYAYLSRGSAYNKLKKYKLALIDFNKVLMLDPKNQEAYNNRGWAKKFSGNFEGACQDWKKSKKLGNREAKIIMKNNRCK